ncbi:MAG: hypothetical protein ACRC6E_03730 [Fusobacteriaceae bacterium]
MFKEGAGVYDIRHGFGSVKSITHSEDFPIYVEFDECDDIYTMDGKDASFNINPCLFDERFGINFEAWKCEFEHPTPYIERW